MHLSFLARTSYREKAWELEGWGNPANGRMVAWRPPRREGFSGIEK
jgi:hypothetical protein